MGEDLDCHLLYFDSFGSRQTQSKRELKDNDLSDLCQRTQPVINSALKPVTCGKSVEDCIHLGSNQFITYTVEYKDRRGS